MPRDEPQGCFVSRKKGERVTVRRYHLYRDCGMLVGEEETGGDYEVIDLSQVEGGQQTIDLLGLTPCSPCSNRSKEVSALDLIAETIGGYDLTPYDPEDEGSPDVFHVPDEDATLLAEHVIDMLESNGYKIRRLRRGGA